MTNTPDIPSFKGFGGGGEEERKKKAAVALAWKIGAGALLLALGAGAAVLVVVPRIVSKVENDLANKGQKQSVFSREDDMRHAPSPSMSGGGDSLSMIRGGGSLYGPAAAAKPADAGAGAGGADGQGAAAGADGQANGADANGQAGAAAGAAGQGGAAPEGSGAGDWRRGLGASGLSPNMGGGSAGSGGGASMNYSGKGGGKIIALGAAQHRVVSSEGYTPNKAFSARRGFAQSGNKAVSKTGPSATAVTTAAPPPPATPPAQVASSGNNISGGGAGNTGNPAPAPPPAPSGGGGGGGSGGGGGGGGGSGSSGSSGGGGDRGGGACFIAGTRVMTPEGPRAIETLKRGDLVYAIDTDTYELSPRRVLETHFHPDRPLHRVELSGGRVLTTTFEHRFWDAAARDYRGAGLLKPGDRLLELTPVSEAAASFMPMLPPTRLLPDEDPARLLAPASRAPAAARELTVVSSGPLGRRADVYNITVEGLSNYLAEGVVVHNLKCVKADCGAN